jgi:dolichyl-phosphate beta-glucosyltransferase
MSLDRRREPVASFIIPSYNAAGFLAANLEDVRRWLRERPEPWEMIVVDDASRDDTPRIIDEFVRGHPDEAIYAARFIANRGKGFAIRVGLGLARGKYAVFTDCDLAYPVSNTARVLAELEAGADAAIACRVLPESTYFMSPSFFSYLYTRHLMGRIFNLLCRLITVPRIQDTQAGLKGFRTEVVRPILGRLAMSGFSFDVELLRALIDREARIVEIPVTFRYDTEPSTVLFIMDSLRMFRDLVHIRYRSMVGRYRRRPVGSAALVVHADDFGLAPGVNKAIEEGLASKAVTSTSVLTGTPHCAEALSWAAAHPQFDYGVHLNLTHGRPVLPASEVPSLVTRSGEFPSLSRLAFRLMTGRVRTEEVLKEWRAQVAAVRAAGVTVSHLNSHQHVHLLPRLYSRASAPLALGEGLPLRAMDGPIFWRKGRPDIKGMLLAVASRAAMRSDGSVATVARGFGAALASQPTVASLRADLSRTEPGVTYELVVHPGVVDEALRTSGDTYLGEREVEWEFLASEEFRALLRDAGLILTDFKRASHATAA